MPSLFSAFTRRSQPTTTTSNAAANFTPTPPVPPSAPAEQPQTRQQTLADSRQVVDSALRNAGTTLDAELQTRAKNIHSNAAQLAEQDKRVEYETAALAAEGDEIERFLGDAERELGDEGLIGDFEDEIARLEQDLDILDGILDEAEGEAGMEVAKGSEVVEEHDGRAKQGEGLEDAATARLLTTCERCERQYDKDYRGLPLAHDSENRRYMCGECRRKEVPMPMTLVG